MKNKSILIIGLGSIGTRYVEAIYKNNFFNKIYFFDKEKISKKITKKNKKNLKIYFLNNLKKLPSTIDMLILSTTSKDRLKILKNILINTKIKFAIIEKVLGQSLEQLDEFEKIGNKHKNFYVNTLKKNEEIFVFLRKKIKNLILKKIYLKGYNWNLCCNAIHYIDLFENIVNQKVKSMEFVKEGKWFKSKRKGYLECNGKLTMFFKKKIYSYLECSKKNKKNILFLEFNNNKKILIDLDKNIYAINNKKKKFEETYLSKMMPLIIKNTLTFKNNGLTSLQNSSIQHKKMLGALIKNFRPHKNTKILPIT